MPVHGVITEVDRFENTGEDFICFTDTLNPGIHYMVWRVSGAHVEVGQKVTYNPERRVLSAVDGTPIGFAPEPSAITGTVTWDAL